jgi:cephalosporin hydroxylase
MQYELDCLIATMRQRSVRSYLEVGARYGDTFYDVMRSLPPGSRGVAIDLPGEVWGTQGTEKHLYAAADELRGMGYDITVLLGSSQHPDILKQAAALGPYDACLLDADHRYDAIKSDFEAYSPMCAMVALHDIVGHGQRHARGVDVEVPRFWQEIRRAGCMEFTATETTMGIGAWFRT